MQNIFMPHPSYCLTCDYTKFMAIYWGWSESTLHEIIAFHIKLNLFKLNLLLFGWIKLIWINLFNSFELNWLLTWYLIGFELMYLNWYIWIGVFELMDLKFKSINSNFELMDLNWWIWIDGCELNFIESNSEMSQFNTVKFGFDSCKKISFMVLRFNSNWLLLSNPLNCRFIAVRCIICKLSCEGCVRLYHDTDTCKTYNLSEAPVSWYTLHSQFTPARSHPPLTPWLLISVHSYYKGIVREYVHYCHYTIIIILLCI